MEKPQYETRTLEHSIGHPPTIRNAVKAVGEAFLPGASHLLDGDIRSGAAHAVGAMAARLVLGPIGWLAVGVNSFTSSVTGRPFHRHFVRYPGERHADRDAESAAHEALHRHGDGDVTQEEYEAAVAAAADTLQARRGARA